MNNMTKTLITTTTILLLISVIMCDISNSHTPTPINVTHHIDTTQTDTLPRCEEYTPSLGMKISSGGETTLGVPISDNVIINFDGTVGFGGGGVYINTDGSMSIGF